MNPLVADVHIDVALTNLSIRYSNEEYIAEEIFKPFPVDKESNYYFIYGKENLRSYNSKRAPATRATEVDWSVSKALYGCTEYSLEHPIPNEVRDEADMPLNPEMDATEMLTDMLLLDLEKRVATAVTTAGNYATANKATLTGGQRWDDYTASSPLEDIQEAASIIHGAVQRKPNTLMLGYQVFQALKNHPLVMARLSYLTLKVLTTDLLAELFEVDRVLVGSAVNITSQLGAATTTTGYVWGKYVWLGYVGNPGLKTLTFGQLFRRNGFKLTEKWYEQQRKATVVRVADKTDEKIIAADAGFLFSTVIS